MNTKITEKSSANKPLVTVIVPAYNHEKYIEACLKSVVEQTYENMQIIVLNDGSKDKTGFMIEKFIEKQNRKIEYISKDNEGLCKTLNRALKISKGKYIATIASDDIWSPNKIEEQVNFLEENKSVGLVYSDAYFLKMEKKTTMKYSEYKPKIKKHFKNSIQNVNMYESLLVENVILAVTVVTRKECFDKVGFFDDSLKYEDYDMWLRIAKHYPIGYIDKPLAYYRIHDANISNNTRFMLIGALQAIKKQFKEEPLKSRPQKSIVLCLMFLFTALKNRVNKIYRVRR